MWNVRWFLGVGLARSVAILNAMRFELDADRAASQKSDSRNSP
ncbi:MAG: cytochrome bd-I oxidase subunit CydX [Steroidobacteraceae bacterium]